jgi:hypothetical protein
MTFERTWNVELLLEYLKSSNLNLDEEDLNIIHNQKIDGHVFLDMTEEKFMADGMKRDPAMKLVEQVQFIKKQLTIPFGKSSYFQIFPPSQWSFTHFQQWSTQLWPTTDKEMGRKIFYQVLYNFRDDSHVSLEVHDVVTNLLKQKKKVSIIIKSLICI